MRNYKITFFCALLILLFSLNCLAQDDIFQPIYTFQGSIAITLDSYFCHYPDDPIVTIPEGITDEEELAKWIAEKKHDEDIRRIFTLSNPTTPGISQNVELEFFANPVENLEILIKLKHRGLWGGSGTSSTLSFPLVLKDAYACYYTDWALFTVGRFGSQLGPLALLLSDQYDSREGLMVNTLFHDTWITLVVNRLLMSMYRDYPYVSTYLLDDLLATRFSKRYGDNLIGLNLIFDGFYDEKAISFDFDGKLARYPIKAELGFVYPAWVYRELFPDRLWPGGVISLNLFDNHTHQLSLRLGGFSKGFIAQYGMKAGIKMETPVKFNPNTGGIDLLYQRGLSDDLVLGLNLVWQKYLDSAYQEQSQMQFPLKIFETKLQKYLSQASDISVSLAYIGDNIFNYGKFDISWQARF